jgi:hypothetical protein
MPFPWQDAAAGNDAAAGVDGGSDGAIEAGGDGGSDADGGIPAGPDGGAPAPFSVIVLPDTQYYSSSFPQIFEEQVQWIAAERLLGNVAFVLHEGDIVDTDHPDQWQRASRSLHMLDNAVPYLLAAGNHDYTTLAPTRATMIDAYFPTAQFAARPWFKGTFEADRIDNSYAIFEIPNGGGTWLVLSLEFGPRDGVLAWADGVAKQHGTLPAIVLTHAYLYDDDTRYDHVLRPQQAWNPHAYAPGTPPGTVNDGEEMWQKLVLGNSNIRFVLCGHVLNTGVGRLTSTRPDGSIVHQILANYQNEGAGGNGFLRVMQFFPAQRQVQIRTYSPYLDVFKTDPENQFALDY